MPKSTSLLRLIPLALAAALPLRAELFVSTDAAITFSSSTSLASFDARNDSVAATLDSATGEVAFAVPMQAFRFEKALMQKHFNQPDYLDTARHPEARFKGRITNLAQIDFTRDGRYPTTITGQLTIRDQTRELTHTGMLVIKKGVPTATATFDLDIAAFGLTFTKGKSAGKIARVVAVEIKAPYARAPKS